MDAEGQFERGKGRTLAVDRLREVNQELNGAARTLARENTNLRVENDDLRAAAAKLQDANSTFRASVGVLTEQRDSAKTACEDWLKDSTRQREHIKEQAAEIKRLSAEYNARLSEGSRSEVAYMNEIDEQGGKIKALLLDALRLDWLDDLHKRVIGGSFREEVDGRMARNALKAKEAG